LFFTSHSPSSLNFLRQISISCEDKTTSDNAATSSVRYAQCSKHTFTVQVSTEVTTLACIGDVVCSNLSHSFGCMDRRMLG